MSDELITVKEASELSGYNQEWVRQLAREGEVDFKKFGPTVMIYKKSLIEYKARKDKEREEKRSRS